MGSLEALCQLYLASVHCICWNGHEKKSPCLAGRSLITFMTLLITFMTLLPQVVPCTAAYAHNW